MDELFVCLLALVLVSVNRVARGSFTLQPQKRENPTTTTSARRVVFFFGSLLLLDVFLCVSCCGCLKVSAPHFFINRCPYFIFGKEKKILNKREEIEFKRPSCCEMNVLDLWSPWTGSQPNRKDLLSWPSFGSK